LCRNIEYRGFALLDDRRTGRHAELASLRLLLGTSNQAIVQVSMSRRLELLVIVEKKLRRMEQVELRRRCEELKASVLAREVLPL
jgi:hypothetical protein